jgi:hypothetical protein
MWVLLPVFDGAFAYPETLVNLESWKYLVAEGAAQSKFKDGSVEILIDIEFNTLANQIKVLTGGKDILGNDV